MTTLQDLEFIEKKWGVPAIKGQRVRYQGHPAEIIGATPAGQLKLRFRYPQDKQFNKFEFHPIVHMDYGDGIDHEARFSDEVAEWRREQGLPV